MYTIIILMIRLDCGHPIDILHYLADICSDAFGQGGHYSFGLLTIAALNVHVKSHEGMVL